MKMLDHQNLDSSMARSHRPCYPKEPFYGTSGGNLQFQSKRLPQAQNPHAPVDNEEVVQKVSPHLLEELVKGTHRATKGCGGTMHFRKKIESLVTGMPFRDKVILVQSSIVPLHDCGWGGIVPMPAKP